MPADDPANLWPQWAQAAATPAVDEALRHLLSDLDRRIVERGPVCQASGRCCDFGTYGHRLFVTGLEIAWFLRQAPALQPEPAPAPSAHALTQWPGPAETPRRDVCPHQIDGKCSTHPIRPTGCRIYFCQAGTEIWQNELYELFLGRLRQLHETHDLPYRYMDWMHGLREGEAVLSGQR